MHNLCANSVMVALSPPVDVSYSGLSVRYSSVITSRRGHTVNLSRRSTICAILSSYLDHCFLRYVALHLFDPAQRRRSLNAHCFLPIS